MKQKVLELLHKMVDALESARPEIDDLNGRMYDAFEQIEASGLPLSEDAEESLHELQGFYQELPVWDTINTMIEHAQTIIDELEE